MRIHVCIFIIVIMSLGFSITNVNAERNNPYSEALPAWQKVLTQYVDDKGRTDFVRLNNNRSDLERFVKAIESVSPSNNPDLFTRREEKIAYYINAYNALAMMGILERNLPKHFNSFFRRASFFKFRSVVVGGKKTDLYTFENKVIRPLDEPRVHFALNCMVKDCPRLPQTVFKAETLEQNLDALANEFLNKEIHIKIDHTKKILYLSSILDFYTKDFVESGKARDLIPYVNKYSNTKIPPNYKVKFIKYDWTVNQQP